MRPVVMRPIITAMLLLQWCCGAIGTAMALRCCSAVVAAMVLRRCCYNDGAARLRRCYYNDGVVALWLNFILFFLLNSFRRENESEKEKRE